MIKFTKLCINLRSEIQRNGKIKTRAKAQKFLKMMESYPQDQEFTNLYREACIMVLGGNW